MEKAEKVRNTYASLTDDQLIQIANKEADDLTPLGYNILQEEINRRGLYVREKIFKHEIPDDVELDKFIDLIEGLSCPGCGSREKPLRSRITREVISMVVFTNSHECPIIGCEDCLKKWDRANRLKTALLGWWGLPYGIVKTYRALAKNRAADKAPQRENEDTFDQFIIENIGLLRAYQDDEEKLVQLLKRQNERR